MKTETSGGVKKGRELHKGRSGLMSDLCRPMLVAQLRRILGLFVLFELLFMASVHWLAGSVESSLLMAGVRDAVVMVVVRETLERLNTLLLVAGLVMVPLTVMAALLVSRFVDKYFSDMETFSRRKTQFVSMVAHELRTPLNSIKGFADLLVGLHTFRPGSEQEEYLEEIRGGAGRLKAIVNELLDLSRIEAGRIELDRAQFAIGPVIDGAVGAVLPQAGLKKIEVRVEGNRSALAYGDPVRTRQVITNLLSNAVKFGPHESVVTVGMETVAGGFLQVSVADAGGGIPPADLPHIFEEFKQTRAGKDVAVEGTGLGLAISRKLAELQGGMIRAENGKPCGAVFRFNIPVADNSTAIVGEARVMPGRIQPAGEAF